MNITINNRPADITLDTERTLGDVLSGMEQWLAASGNRILGVSVNGADIGESLSAVFDRDIGDIKKLDVSVSFWAELAAEALAEIHTVCMQYGDAGFAERAGISGVWDESAAARFLAADIPDMFSLAKLTFSGEGLSPQDFSLLIEERLREIGDPVHEIRGSESLVLGIAARMEELSLDVQTGKDHRAAETIQQFSALGEKLFRLFSILKARGLSPDTLVIDNRSARIFIEEFNAALKELSAAYENRDTVLVGDLTEYELAPRLLQFFSALKDFSASSPFSISAMTADSI